MLDSLLNRLKREGTYEQYDADMKSLLDKGYAEIIPEDQIKSKSNVNYLPHHYVLVPKWRVVFNAASKFKGASLNDRCLQGPNLLSDIVGVLMRFRKSPMRCKRTSKRCIIRC